MSIRSSLRARFLTLVFGAFVAAGFACSDDGSGARNDVSDASAVDGSDLAQVDSADLDDADLTNGNDTNDATDGADVPEHDTRDSDVADDTVITSTLTCAPAACGDSNGATIGVSAGDDLQSAIDAASPGDTLLLEAGATFTGHFVLPEKAGDACITIRTATPDAELPEGVRVTPADAPRMASLVTPGAGLPALRTQPRAHHYRLIGLEIRPESASSEVYNLVSLGSNGADQTSLEQVPHHIVIERCYIHAWPDANFKRGIGLDSASSCVADSHISDFHSDVQDSQAIGGFNGPGPFRIINNRLEGAAENIMFGGAVPSIPQLVPSDIEIRGNHFFKPLAWRAGDPANTGYVPWVKNLFEIKNGRNVVLEGNILENNWVGADQHGTAVVLTPRSEGGAVPWAVVENVTIANNIFRHVGGGVAILDRDSGGSSQLTNRIFVRGNLFEDIRQDYALDIVRVFQFTGIETLVIDHNTFVYGPGSWPVLRTYGNPTTGFAYTNNIVEYREGPWSDCGNGPSALDCILPGAQFAGNVLIGGTTDGYPGTNHAPAALADVGFVDFDAGGDDHHNYGLSDSSPFRGAGADGADPGFDPAAVDAALRGSAP